MDKKTEELYDKAIRSDVSRFLADNKTEWKAGAVQFIKLLKNEEIEAVLFGGTIRSLLYARNFSNKFGRPRDVDIVVYDKHFNRVVELINESNYIAKRVNRFGGLSITVNEWNFDIWPLGQTYIIANNASRYPSPTFHDLPSTTFLNIESIAVDLFPGKSGKRSIYTGGGAFYAAFVEKKIDIINEENPFPGLCVVRALRMAMILKWKLSKKLISYLIRNMERMSFEEFSLIQKKHYGKVFWGQPCFNHIKDELSQMAYIKEDGAILRVLV